ncbi:MAG: acylneuraminate cytidylyltransferase family protein [Methanobacteriota archaeon]
MPTINILGIIPARGGSKAIPKKNIIPLAGKPLIQYTIDAALHSKMITKVIVSTDSKEIATLSKKLGAEVPFIRPKHLATDTAKTLDVTIHAIHQMEKKDKKTYDIAVLLQPTTPLRKSKHIDEALQLLIKHKKDTDSVISVVDVGANHPLRMKRIVNGILVNYIDQGHEDTRPRQHLPPVYIRNGALYIAWRDVLLTGSITGKKSRAYLMPPEYSINIDTNLDIPLAEYLLRKEKQKK